MALNQLPIVEASIQIVHSGPTAGASFIATLDASDGAPVAPQQVFTFDLSVYAPDMVGLYPQADVYRVSTNERVEADVVVSNSLITITFFEAVTPSEYRMKAVA